MLRLISLKYSPGLKKEMEVIYNQLLPQKRIVLYSHTRYLWSDGIEYVNVTSGHSIITYCVDFFKIVKLFFLERKVNNVNVFYNPHPFNFVFSAFAKLRGDKNYIVLHEPYKPISELMNYEITLAIYLKIAAGFQWLSSLFAENIIVMSRQGAQALSKNRYYERFNSPIVSSLLVPDNTKRAKRDRKYISFVGRVNENKGIKDFVQAARYCRKHEINLNFVVISSDSVDNYLNDEDVLSDNLQIIQKQNLKDSDIEEIISLSFACCILHKSGTQSGVLPLCLSYGVPVLIRNIAAFTQYVENPNWILDVNFTSHDFVKKVLAIRKKKEAIEEAIDLYRQHFDVRLAAQFYREIIT